MGINLEAFPWADSQMGVSLLRENEEVTIEESSEYIRMKTPQRQLGKLGTFVLEVWREVDIEGAYDENEIGVVFDQNGMLVPKSVRQLMQEGYGEVSFSLTEGRFPHENIQLTLWSEKGTDVISRRFMFDYDEVGLEDHEDGWFSNALEPSKKCNLFLKQDPAELHRIHFGVSFAY